MRFSSKIVPVALFFVFLAIYLHNLSPDVYGGDVGDIVTAAYVFGVPHAPGYPLFTLLGFILTRIPFKTPAYMVGLISVISSASSVVLFYLISLQLTKRKFISLVSSLILGFTFIFWFYAEIAEVFALNSFFAVLLIFLSLKFDSTKKAKFLYLLVFILGLSLTHHQTIVLIFPSIFIIIFPNLLRFLKKPKKALLLLSLFLLGLLPYIYIPIASFRNPVINWDNVKDLNSFFHLLFRKDYGTLQAGDFDAPNIAQRLVDLKIYLSFIATQLTLPVILVSLLGMFSLAKDKIRLFLSLAIGYLISGPIFVTYAAFPILSDFYIGVYERFFTLSAILLLLFFPLGLSLFTQFINNFFKKNLYEHLFTGVFLLIPIFLFVYNFPKTDLSHLSAGSDFTNDIFSPLPKDSALFLTGDTTLFDSWYSYYVLGFRKDVKLINLSGIVAGDFYNQEKKTFLKKNPEYKDDEDLFARVMENISQKRDVFALVRMQPKKGKKLTWMPYGLVWKLIETEKELPTKEEFTRTTLELWSSFKFPKSFKKGIFAMNNPTVSAIRTNYSDALLGAGNYLITRYKDYENYKTFVNFAVKFNPNEGRVYEARAIYYINAKECKKAEEDLNEAISLSPLDRISYFLLFSNYYDCLNDKNLARLVAVRYKIVFGEDFFKSAKEYSKQKWLF